MEIKRITVGPLAENSYAVLLDSCAVIIDPGGDYEKIKRALCCKPCAAVLLTHAHIDHIEAAAAMQEDGAKIYLHRDDVKLLKGGGNLASLFGIALQKFEPDFILSGGERLRFEDAEIEVLHTPGHTEGSVCYILNDVIFSGDTLFCESVGRTDFESGSAAALHCSIANKLFALSGDYKILPGHGCETDLAHEKKYNPYV